MQNQKKTVKRLFTLRMEYGQNFSFNTTLENIGRSHPSTWQLIISQSVYQIDVCVNYPQLPAQHRYIFRVGDDGSHTHIHYFKFGSVLRDPITQHSCYTILFCNIIVPQYQGLLQGLGDNQCQSQARNWISGFLFTHSFIHSLKLIHSTTNTSGRLFSSGILS